MSRLITIVIVCLAAVGIVEAASSGNKIGIHLYHQSLSPDGGALLPKPYRLAHLIGTLRALGAVAADGPDDRRSA